MAFFFHGFFLGQIMCTVNIHIQRTWGFEIYICGDIGFALYIATSNTRLHRICMGKTEEMSVLRTPIAYLWTLSVSYSHFPCQRKVLQELLMPWQITVRPCYWVFRRRWHGCVQEEHEWMRGRHLLSLLGQVWNGSPSEERTRWLWHVRLSEGK